MNELKACPFCGGEAEAIHEINGMWTVECVKCGALVDGIKAWNTRAPMSYEDLKILLDELGVSERTCHPVIAITEDGGYEYALCSECDGRIEPEDNYCPNCGAKVVSE